MAQEQKTQVAVEAGSLIEGLDLLGPDWAFESLKHILYLNEEVYERFFLCFTLADLIDEDEFGKRRLDLQAPLARWEERFGSEEPRFVFTTLKPPFLWVGPVPNWEAIKAGEGAE